MAAVKGWGEVAGIPKTVVVNSDEVREALAEPINAIVEAALPFRRVAAVGVLRVAGTVVYAGDQGQDGP